MLSFWNSLVLVSAGGALGATLRYMMVQVTQGLDFPLSTLLVNGIGSFLIGFFVGLGQSQESLFAKPGPRYLIITGILGGFTTFSAFSIETLQFFQSGETVKAFLNIILNNATGILLAFLGYLAATSLKNG